MALSEKEIENPPPEIHQNPPLPSVPPVSSESYQKINGNSKGAPYIPPPPAPPSHSYSGHKQIVPQTPVIQPHPPPSSMTSVNSSISTASLRPPPPSMPLANSAVPPPPPSMPSVNSAIPPPPPPPPPPPSFTSSSANVSSTINSSPRGDSHSALMEQIRNKPISLNHVEPSEVSTQTTVNSSGGEGIRDQLMFQIRKGVDLKKVEPQTNKTKAKAPTAGLAGALARALQERSRAINQTDDSSDSDSDGSDDEWED